MRKAGPLSQSSLLASSGPAGPDGFDQCPSDTAAGAEDDRHTGPGKRHKVKLGIRCARGFKLPGHPRFAPSLIA